MGETQIIEGFRRNFWVKLLVYTGFTASFAFIQLSFSFLISLWGLTPDLLLLLLVWICLVEGQFYGLFAGFLIGIFFDIVSMNIIGVNALSKTVAAYLIGFFYKEDSFMNTIRSNKIFIILFISSLANNLIYYLVLINLLHDNFVMLYLKYSFGTTFYTMLVSLVLFFFRIRKFW